MAQIGEFSFIIITSGLVLGVISNTIYPIIVAVAGVTTFATPYLIRFSEYIVQWLDLNLSPNTKIILNNYAAWVYRATSMPSQDNKLRKAITRIIVNAIMVAIIFSVMHYFIPRTISLFPERHLLENGIFLLIALALASPFIWGMLFSYQSIRARLTSVQILIWMLTLAEVSVLSLIYFKTWIALVVYLIIALIFFVLLYRHFETSYRWFERQLVENIGTNKKTAHFRYEELAPWDTHLVEIEVGNLSPLIGKRLNEAKIRETFHINVVAIAHGPTIVPAPRGDEEIRAHDKLIVLGNDEQIDEFKKIAEPHTRKQEIVNMLDKFALKSILLKAGNSMIAKTIKSSNIRENIGGIVVGLERDNRQILNPSPGTVLRVNDVIMMVAEIEKFEALAKKRKARTEKS